MSTQTGRGEIIVQDDLDRVDESNALAWQMVGWLQSFLARHIGHGAAVEEVAKARRELEPSIRAFYAKVRARRTSELRTNPQPPSSPPASAPGEG